MTPLSQGRMVTLLVWSLVAIGLLSGALTAALVGSTLVDLNREQVALLEREKALTQKTARLQKLGQEAREEIQLLLAGRAVPSGRTIGELGLLLDELRADYPHPLPRGLFDEIEGAVEGLRDLRLKAQEWSERYRVVAEDLAERRTLSRVRDQLETLRAAAETLEGRHRLEEALLLRRWRQAPREEAASLAGTILDNQVHYRARALKEVRTDLSELSRLVESLAGEDHIDQLADLKDNQLKPLLERLERQVGAFAAEAQGPQELTPAMIADLRDALFGGGHAVIKEYQTIRIGDGGLFRLAGDVLTLERERLPLEAQARELYGRIEAVHPVLAAQAVERGRALTRHAEESLSRGLNDLMAVGVFFLGSFVGLGGVISARVRRQVFTLGQLQRQQDLILNSAGEGILGLDRQGRAAFANPTGERLLGWEPDQLIGRAHPEFLRPVFADGSPRNEKSLDAVLERGDAFRRDDEIIARRDGTILPVDLTATPIRNETGEIEGAVVVLLDISERKTAEAALQRSYLELDELNRSLEEKVALRTVELEAKSRQLIRAQEELLRREKLAAIGSLAAGVAHEVNNPTAIIRGNVEILLRKLPKDDVRREEAEEILKNTERISRITRGLLDLARDQAMTSSPEEVQIDALLGEILVQVPHQIPCDTVEVRTEFAPETPAVRADREQLRQVFTNLVLNALQAMEKGGRLTLRSAVRDRCVVVEVEDTGPGIPPEIREQIFHPFFTTKGTGTGLGLAICSGIVQTMGGRLEVESGAGAGALFRVRLPLKGG